MNRVMVARYIQERDVQQRDDVLEIRVGEVAASDDQFNIFEMTVVAKAVESFNDLITDCKDFHCTGILP